MINEDLRDKLCSKQFIAIKLIYDQISNFMESCFISMP